MNKSQTKDRAVRFGELDILIILLVLAVIGAIFLRVFLLNDKIASSETAVISYTVVDVADNTAHSLHTGATVYLASNNDAIGHVDSANTVPTQVYAENDEGDLVPAEHPTRKNIVGTVTLRGLWTEDGFLINGDQLATSGKTLFIYTEEVECILTIGQISKPE